MNDILVVVVAQPATEFLVVHLGLVLAYAPATRHLVRIGQLEFPAVAGPRNEALAVLVGEQLQKELPQLNWTRARETWSGSCKNKRKKHMRFLVSACCVGIVQLSRGSFEWMT